jgi:hypothetical protein
MLLIGMLLVWPVLADAVVVAPHALFLTDDARVGDLRLVNNGAEPEEVVLDFEYGYPLSDTAGEMRVVLIPSPEPGAPSSAAWLRAFPRRVLLQPGQSQTVRIRAEPPDGLPAGEYWSRLVVTSTPATAPPSTAADSTVRVGITFRVRTITSVTFRKGRVETSVELDSLSASAAGGELDTWWTPAARFYQIHPDPNRFTRLDIPLIRTIEIIGEVRLQPGNRFLDVVSNSVLEGFGGAGLEIALRARVVSLELCKSGKVSG